jgi:23S rRNA pseudouridine2457 synthase
LAKLILFNKPFNVLCQFSDSDGHETLAGYIDIPGVYPAGRLDSTSEGLVILTDDGTLQHRIAHPDRKLEKTYLVQVDGDIDDTAISALQKGVTLKDGLTRPATARKIEEPDLWQRLPPVRYRAHIPTSWIELKIREGKNRQVRRMTAAVGFPTLRLVRSAIGPWQIGSLAPGEFEQHEVS